MDTHLSAQDAITLLPVVERATDRIAHVVVDQQLQPGQPSLLPGWTIANVLSHLWYGAVASLRMTKHVLEGHGEVDFELNWYRPSSHTSSGALRLRAKNSISRVRCPWRSSSGSDTPRK